jgi:TatD DNase family protein
MLDSHCHLNDEKLFSRREDVIKRAHEAEVTILLVVGWDLESSKKAIQIAHENEGIFAAVGLHPENIAEAPADILCEIKELARDNKVIAIGEIGLDYHWYKDLAVREAQKTWFVRQIDLANELNLPISIHARDASEDVYEILSKHPPLQKGVLHCYSGSTEMLHKFADLGMYFGFDGPITYKGSAVPKANVIACPFDRLLTETDSPYLTPEPYRGEINEPKFIKVIFEKMTLLRKQNPEILEKQIEDNFKKLFHVELVK